jgi:hypothetical protein
MLALLYLLAAVWIGDVVARRFFAFGSVLHRLAAAFIVGLLLSTWVTYLGVSLYPGSPVPLLGGNLLFAALVLAAFRYVRRAPATWLPRPAGRWIWDVAMLVLWAAFTTWLMYTSLDWRDGVLLMGGAQWSDFGATTAIIQSFVQGRNFPPEYPHFPGLPLSYHYLFHFQAANLTWLGWRMHTSFNLLAILSILSMLVCIATLGERLFRSRAAGRYGAMLFFFHSMLGYAPFLSRSASLGEAWTAIVEKRGFLESIYPFRGEMWGIWTLNIIANQRHLPSAIAAFLLVLILLVEAYAWRLRWPRRKPRAAGDPTPDTLLAEAPREPAPVPGGTPLRLFASCAFVGGALVLVALFVLLPLRQYALALLSTAAIVGVPQLLLWRAGGGSAGAATYPHYQFGYVVSDPTLTNVFKYLSFTFGFKWLLLLAAFFVLGRLGRSFLAACLALPAVGLLVRFSIEDAANHKFFFVWIAIANVAVAYVLYRIARRGIFGLAGAALLTVSITLGGFIDIFHFLHDDTIQVPMEGHNLYEWVRENTDPHDIFLTEPVVTSQILLAGRKVFYGYDYYAWSAGYPTAERVTLFRELYSEADPERLVRRLNEHHIDYVAFDNPFSQGEVGQNEYVFRAYFAKVFEGATGYDGFRLYEVPTVEQWVARGGTPLEPLILPTPRPLLPAPPPDRFQRALDGDVRPSGDLVVVDTAAAAIHRVSAAGHFAGGLGAVQYKEPQGVAVAPDDTVYVADTWNQRVVRLGSDGTPIGELPPPAEGFYAPRDVAVAPDGAVYVVNTGRSQVVRYERLRLVRAWGTLGSEPGQFREPVALAASSRHVWVADYMNARIQVFTHTGRFVREWPVAEWKDGPQWHRPGIALSGGRVYVSSPGSHAVLVFSEAGARLAQIAGEGLVEPEGLTALADGGSS